MSENVVYQDFQREELIGGKVVMMSPRPAFNHNQVSSNIYYLFAHFLRGKKCTPIADGMDLYLDDDNRFVPDFMIVCDRSKIKRSGVHGVPDLLVEVLSPGTAKNDKWHKKNVYEAHGVQEYWIVEPSNRSIEVYLLRDGRYELDNLYALYPAEELEEMTDEEKAAVITEFKCHLFDDLIIRLDDIFYDLF